jgi:ADP-heptose:LPS heptosyltransferase
MLRAFQLEVTGDPTDAIVANVGYETCVRVKSPLNYLEWIGAQLGLYGRENDDDKLGKWFVPPARPRLDLPPMQREMGRRDSATVLMFPDCHSPPRTWPKNYFIELGLLFARAGIKLKVVYEKREPPFTVFHDIYDKSMLYVTAAIQQAKLVICNDSGPAHVAGTIGTPVIAIHGMTSDRIYRYLPKGAVTSICKKSLGCQGCHALPPCRASCESGCHELYRTFPEEVFEKAMQLLGANEEAKAA